MDKKELRLLKQQNELVRELVLGIKQVMAGKTKPFK